MEEANIRDNESSRTQCKTVYEDAVAGKGYDTTFKLFDYRPFSDKFPSKEAKINFC